MWCVSVYVCVLLPLKSSEDTRELKNRLENVENTRHDIDGALR